MATANDLVAAPTETVESFVDALWHGRQDTIVIKKGGEEFKVVVRKAKVRELTAITAVFRKITERINEQNMLKVVEMVVDMQMAEQAISGKKTFAVTKEQVAEKLKADGVTFITILERTVDLIPEIVPSFTNLSKEEVDELDLDDAVLIITGIIGANYSFFTHSLRPIFEAVMAGFGRKLQEGKSAEPSS